MQDHHKPQALKKPIANWKYIPVAILIVLVFFVILHKLKRDPIQQPIMNLQPWALQTDVVKTGNVNAIFPALGKVESSSEITLAPQIGGRVLSLGPREGSKIKQGQLLIKIDTRELIANKNALKAQLLGARNAAETAERDYERAVKLQADHFIAEAALDAKKAKTLATIATVDSLKSQIRSLDIKISYGVLTAPLDSRVTYRNVEIGDRVFPGKPVYKLSAQNGGRVIIPVPLSTLTTLQPGSKVELMSSGQVLPAKITRINPALDQFSMGSLEIDLPERPFNLPDGSPISVNVLTNTLLDSLIVPTDSLMPSNDPIHKNVFIVRDTNPQTLRKIPVQIKLCGREGCAVSGDLNADDTLVTAHGSVLLKLHDGDTVTTDWNVEAEQ